MDHLSLEGPEFRLFRLHVAVFVFETDFGNIAAERCNCFADTAVMGVVKQF